MENYTINENLDLIINATNDKLKITDKLITDIKAKIFFNPGENYSESITALKLLDTKISFNFKGKPVEFLNVPIKCKLSKENKTISIFSVIHFKLILQKIEYNSPYYIQNEIKIIIINKNNISLPKIYMIEIKELTQNEQLLINFYNDIEKLYSTPFIIGDSTYEFISFNYKDYFRINIDKSKKFYYIDTTDRQIMYDNIKTFISDNEINDKILAFCGPYGIGKSISSLYIQKDLYNRKKNHFILI